MKLRKFVFIGAMLLAQKSFSQDTNKYKEYEDKRGYFSGYIIRNDSSKEMGLVKDNMMNQEAQFLGVTFISKNGDKVSFSPGSILGYGYMSHDFVSDHTYFYEIEQRGKRVTLYKRLESTPAAASPEGIHRNYSIPREIFYLKKQNERKFKQVKNQKFVRDLAEYFIDCPYLRAKIMAKELKQKDLSKIVYEYNSVCK